MRTPERQDYQDIPKRATQSNVQSQRATVWVKTSDPRPLGPSHQCGKHMIPEAELQILISALLGFVLLWANYSFFLIYFFLLEWECLCHSCPAIMFGKYLTCLVHFVYIGSCLQFALSLRKDLGLELLSDISTSQDKKYWNAMNAFHTEMDVDLGNQG